MNVFKYSVKLYKQTFTGFFLFFLLLKHQTCSLCISTILDRNYSGCKSQRRCCLSHLRLWSTVAILYGVWYLFITARKHIALTYPADDRHQTCVNINCQ